MKISRFSSGPAELLPFRAQPRGKMNNVARIESRVPYLDYRIAELSFMIDPELKQNYLLPKYILRKVSPHI